MTVRRSLVATAIGLATSWLLSAPVGAQDAQTVTDTESSRAILVVVLCLVVLGLVLAAITVWFWNATRPDHPALAPLEVMGDRGFATLSAFEQRQRLDAVRPVDADPEREMPVDDSHREDGAVDLQRLVRETPRSFDDLVDRENDRENGRDPAPVITLPPPATPTPPPPPIDVGLAVAESAPEPVPASVDAGAESPAGVPVEVSADASAEVRAEQ